MDKQRLKRAHFWRLKGPEDPRIGEAGRIVREGGLVAFPTETVYGLGANGLDGAASLKIFAAKKRPADNPLILHVASLEEARQLSSDWNAKMQFVAEKLWPGPLTLVVPAAEHIPKEVTAGLPTVAIRFPNHPIALALIEAAGVPVAAPSANRSGRPSPTLAEHVMDDLGRQVDVILDGGPCRVGLESTILDMSVDPPAILRPGEITYEALTQLLGEVIAPQSLIKQPGKSTKSSTEDPSAVQKAPKAPGMKYRHYAPKAPVTLLLGKPHQIADFVKEQWQAAKAKAETAAAERTAAEAAAAEKEPDESRLKHGIIKQPVTAYLLSEETWALLPSTVQPWDKYIYRRSMGSTHRPREMGRLLYDELRRCDQEKVSRIFVEGCVNQGYGSAVMNRLTKAAANHVVYLDD